MVLWASRPWTDTHALIAPKARSPAFAAYKCPSVFDHHAGERLRELRVPTPARQQPDETLYPPRGTPCDEQGKHRVLFFVDIGAAGVAMLLLQRSGSRHRAATELENVPAVVPGAEAGPSS